MKCLMDFEFRGSKHVCEREDEHSGVHRCSCGNEWTYDESGNVKFCGCSKNEFPCEAHP